MSLLQICRYVQACAASFRCNSTKCSRARLLLKWKQNTSLFSSVISSCRLLRNDQVAELSMWLQCCGTLNFDLFSHVRCVCILPSCSRSFWELFPCRQTFTSGKRPGLKPFIYRRVKLSFIPSPRLSLFVSALQSLRVYWCKITCIFHLDV